MKNWLIKMMITLPAIMICFSCTKQIDSASNQHKAAIISSNHLPNHEKSICPLESTFKTFEQVMTTPEYSANTPCVLEFLQKYVNILNTKINHNSKDQELIDSISIIFEGCNQHNLNGCLYFSKLRNVQGMRSLLLNLAKQNSHDIAKYYFYLNAWSEIKNERIDAELFNLYLAQEKKYRKLISNDKDLLDFHNETLYIISENAKSLEEQTSFENFITNYELTSNKYFSNLDELVFKTLLKNKTKSIYKNKLNLFIEAKIKQQKTLDHFNQTDLAYYLKSLEIPSLDYDIYYLILSSAYHNTGNTYFLNEIATFHKIDHHKLGQIAKTYIQIKFLQVLSLAHKNIVDYFHKQNYTSTTFFPRAISKSTEAFPHFQELDQKSEQLQLFLKSMLTNGKNASSQIYQDLFRNLFSVLDMNIKYMISYPEMMMLIFEFAKKGLNIKMRTFHGGEYELSSNQIMKEFFEGKFPSFFGYNNDVQALSSDEILYSFYFALNTGLFRDFATNNNEYQLVKQFLQIVAEQLSTDELNKLSTDFQTLVSNYQADNTYNTFLNLCNPASNYIHQLTLKESRTSILQGSKVGERLANDPGFYGPSFERSLERIRTNIKRINRQISVMISAYEAYLRKFEKDENKIQQTIQDLNTVLAPINHLTTSYLTQFINRHHEVDHCYFNLYKKEKKLQMDLIAYEEMYLRDLYHQYQQAKKNNSLEVLNQKIKKYGLKGFTGLNKIQNNHFYYTQIDYLVRAKIFIEKGLNLENQQFPPLYKNLKITTPNNEYNWSQHEFYAQSSDTNYFTFDLNSLSEDEFVSSALSNLVYDGLNNPRGFVTWFVDLSFNTYNPFTLNSRSRTMASLYKLGKFEIYEKEECSLKNTGKGCQKITMDLPVTDLLKIGYDLKEFLHINDQEAPILRKVNRNRRIDDFNLAFSIVHPMSNRLENWGIFDLLYYALKEPLLDDYATFPWLIKDENVNFVRDIRMGALDMATSYWNTQNTRGEFLFSISDTFENLLSQKYKEIAWNEINKIRNFEKAIDPDNNPEIKKLQGPIHYEIDKIVEKDILSETLLEEVDGMIRNFHQETNYFYKQANP